MHLVDLVVKRGDAVIRNVPFKSGLNLILDKPTKTKTQSGNDIGKTTVLRLIDFCLGSDGDDIWQDPEFKKKINQEIYDYLHGTIPVSVTLTIISSAKKQHVLTRQFVKKKSNLALQIDNIPYKNITEYRSRLKSLLFGTEGTKPSLRQLMPKFVRSSQILMSKTLKFLGDYGSEVDYEALHLFLFGFFAVDVLEERPRLTATKKKLERDMQTLGRIRKEGEIEQLLLHLRREIKEIGLSLELRGEVPEIAAHANEVAAIRSMAANIAGNLGRFEGEMSVIKMTIGELETEFSGIDRHAVESIYREAKKYLPTLHHDWDDLTKFVQELQSRKGRFLQSQAAHLQKKIDTARAELESLQIRESTEIGTLVQSATFNQALELRADLQEKLKKLGSLEQDLQDIRDLKASIADVEKRLLATKEEIEAGKELLRNRVSIFNKYFSELSRTLYGEQYLLHFEETERGSLSFELTAIGSNVGSGKKMSQTAAFDLAYMEFLRETGINFPKFVCHDGLEAIHGNQLSALLAAANASHGQLILATLRDKLPSIENNFIKENTIIELSHEDKFFRI